MIPKKLWFIWFGNRPNYVDFCIKSFRDFNSDYEINFIYKDNLNSLDQCNKIDRDIIECIEWIKKPSTCKYKELINYDIRQNHPYNVLLSNILRVSIINKYGGIYLDCDTFPIKPFDDKLLSLNNFCSTTLIKGILYKGRYFFGRDIHSRTDKKMLFPTRICYDDLFMNDYKSFRNCSLKSVKKPDNNLTYIEHFTVRYKENDS